MLGRQILLFSMDAFKLAGLNLGKGIAQGRITIFHIRDASLNPAPLAWDARCAELLFTMRARKKVNLLRFQPNRLSFLLCPQTPG
jgi:hypothetical protein